MKKYLFSTVLALSLFSAFGQNGAVPAPPVPASSGYYTEAARPADQVQASFPFDIPLRNAAGDTLNSATVFEKNGKPTVLMFWLTTCGPCRMELKAIKEKYEGWKQEADFNLYAISTDYPKNFPQFVSRVDEGNWQFPAYHDLNREFRLVMPGELNGLPQVFVLDKDGNIAYHTRKYAPGDEDRLFEEIKKLD